MEWANELVGFTGGVAQELAKIFQREVDMQALNARITAERVAAAERRIGKRKSVDGLGQLRMIVPNDTYHYWGRREGYGCWKDKGFLRGIERDNPEVRVESGGTRIQVGYGGIPASAQRRFTKTYA